MQSQTFLHVILITTGIASLITLLVGFNLIRNGRQSQYFRTRQRTIANGWGIIGIALVLGAISGVVFHLSDPLSTWLYLPTNNTPATSQPAIGSQQPQNTAPN